MSSRLVIDGNAVYEIDEECERSPKKRSGGNGRLGGGGSTPGRESREQGAGSSGYQH